MYSVKENGNFFPQLHCKTPYARPNNLSTDPTVSKILKKPRTCENNYGRSFSPAKTFGLRNSETNVPTLGQNHEEPSTSPYTGDIAYGITVTSCAKTIRNGSECEGAHFRPRKSQLSGRRTFDSSFDHSLELKTMTIDDTSEGWKKTKGKTGQETPSKGFQIKSRQNLLRIFTGSVENLLHWSKLKTGLHMLFEVTGVAESVQQGEWKSEKKFWMRDSKSGPKLQVVYHEIDRPLPRLGTNCVVTCIGRMLARNRLQAYKVEECPEDKKNDLQRLSFICNRVADELVSAGQKK